MNVTVNEQPKRFWTFYRNAKESKWVSFVGHEIKVGDYTFFIASLTNKTLSVVEATSGAEVFRTQLPAFVYILVETKEETMEFYRNVIGETLKVKIKNNPNIRNRIKRIQKEITEELGEMPPIEDFDETLIITPISDVLN